MSKRRGNSRGVKNYLWLMAFGPVKYGKCHWCSCELTFHIATIDHEPALAEGGKWRQAVIACNECNQKRGQETERRLQAAAHNLLLQGISSISTTRR